MKSTLKQLFGTLLLVGAVAFTTACGDEEAACTTNADCTTGVCDTTAQVCLGKACTDSTECTDQGDKTECKAAPASVVDQFALICQAPDTVGGTCADETDPDAFCEGQTAGSFCISAECKVPTSCAEVPAAKQGAYCTAQLGESGICNAGTCQPDATPKVAKFIRIVDTTPSGMCDVDSTVKGTTNKDPGSDISIVELLQAGANVGSAKIPAPSAYSPANDPTYTDVNTVFDGAVKAAGERGCPAEDDKDKFFRLDTAVSLGCGGSIVLGFEKDGAEVNLADGNEVRVVELGSYCDTTNGETEYGSDRYRVDICITDQGADFAAIDVNASCGTALSGAAEAGPNNFAVSGVPASSGS